MQYPYELWTRQAGEIAFDDNGNPLPSSEQWVKHGACRDNANTGGKTIQSEDGETVVYAAVIYLPKDTPPLPAKTQIQVRYPDDQGLRIEGTVSRFSPEQFHARLWL